MFLARAFQLSISIFLPFSAALAVWTPFYLMGMFLTFLFMAGLRNTYGDWPVIGPIFHFAIPTSFVMIAHVISVHLYLTGIKTGLQALGTETVRSELKLWGAALVYGLLHAVLALAMFGVVTAIYAVSQIQMPLFIALQSNSLSDPVAEISRSLAFAPATPILPVFASILLIMLRAALLPVLAGTAAGRAPNGRLHEPFGGFGQNFIGLLLLMSTITAVSTLITLFLGRASQYIGLTTTITDQAAIAFMGIVLGEDEVRPPFIYAPAVLGAVCASIWLFTLQCAGAARAYSDSVTQFETRERTEAARHRSNAQGKASDLLRSRMPKF